MIVVTGAGGFIGSMLIRKLNDLGATDIIAVDSFKVESKKNLINGLRIRHAIDRDDLFNWMMTSAKKIECVFHMGARTDTRERDAVILAALNTDYTKKLWKSCSTLNIPLIYASSAATYGNGQDGFLDDENLIPTLKPLNEYAKSKQNFDIWALRQTDKPPFWAGLKFFNVYGPNEFNKGSMASVIFHGYNQIKNSGEMGLFKSHNSLYEHGGQQRDFVYVKDVVDVCEFLMNGSVPSGIYNVGTGDPRSFLDLAKALFSALKKNVSIKFFDIPADLRDNYQYFTAARIEKLRQVGYKKAFHSLEDGIHDYVKQYLEQPKVTEQIR